MDNLNNDLNNINGLMVELNFVMDYVNNDKINELSLTKKLEYYIDSYALVNDMNMLIENKIENNDSTFLKNTNIQLDELKETLINILEKQMLNQKNLTNYEKHLLTSSLSNIYIDQNKDCDDYIISYKELLEKNPQEILDGYANKNILLYRDTQFINDIIILNKDKYLSLKQENESINVNDLLKISKIEDKYNKQLESNITLIKEGPTDSSVFIDVYYKNIDSNFNNTEIQELS